MTDHTPRLSPLAPRLSPRSHRRTPSRSPTRNRLTVTDDILDGLSPADTLEAFTNPSGRLKSSIEAATVADRTFGIRAAIASKNIQEWLDELEDWHWPAEEGSLGFEAPPAKKRKLSGFSNDHGRQSNDNKTVPNQEPRYVGSLLESTVVQYESRIDAIQSDMENLNVEEIKRQVLDTHFSARSRPSSSASNATTTLLSSYTRMDDFTAIVTATVLKALPNLSRLMRLMDVWGIRLSVLQKVPRLLGRLEDAEVALKSGWTAIQLPAQPQDQSSQNGHIPQQLIEEEYLSRETFQIMRDVLQEKVTILGQDLDYMLDTLEGREDTLPELWLDRMEVIEHDYGEWVVAGDRKVRQGEWARIAKARMEQEALERLKKEEDAAARRNAEEANERAKAEVLRLKAEKERLDAEAEEVRRKALKDAQEIEMAEIARQNSIREAEEAEVSRVKEEAAQATEAAEAARLEAFERAKGAEVAKLARRQARKESEESEAAHLKAEKEQEQRMAALENARLQAIKDEQEAEVAEIIRQGALEEAHEAEVAMLNAKRHAEEAMVAETAQMQAENDALDAKTARLQFESEPEDGRNAEAARLQSAEVVEQAGIAKRRAEAEAKDSEAVEALRAETEKRILQASTATREAEQNAETVSSQSLGTQNIERTGDREVPCALCPKATTTDTKSTASTTMPLPGTKMGTLVGVPKNTIHGDWGERNNRTSRTRGVFPLSMISSFDGVNESKLAPPDFHPVIRKNQQNQHSVDNRCQAEDQLSYIHSYPVSLPQLDHQVDPQIIRLPTNISKSTPSSFGWRSQIEVAPIPEYSDITRNSTMLSNSSSPDFLDTESAGSRSHVDTGPETNILIKNPLTLHSALSSPSGSHPPREGLQEEDIGNQSKFTPAREGWVVVGSPPQHATQASRPQILEPSNSRGNANLHPVGHNQDASLVSDYSISEPTPETYEAEPVGYFRPVISPTQNPHKSNAYSELSTQPKAPLYIPDKKSVDKTLPYLGEPSGPPKPQPERPEPSRSVATNEHVIEEDPAEVSNMKFTDGAFESAPRVQDPDTEMQVFNNASTLARKASITRIDGGIRRITIPRSSVSSDASTITSRQGDVPPSPVVAISPASDRDAQDDSLSKEDEPSPSVRRAGRNGRFHEYTSPDSPPPIPKVSERRLLQDRRRDSSASDATDIPSPPLETSFLENIDVTTTPISSPKKASTDDQMRQQISTLLESIPARIRLTSEPPENNPPESLNIKKTRRSITPSLRPSSSLSTYSSYSRAPTPSFTLAPAYGKGPSRPRPQNSNPEIKLYHLSRSTGEAPIKLFVRLVGENGERVMVRVGGGWADLGEYLKEYASHHGRRSKADDGKVEIQDLPSRIVSTSSTASVSTIRGNGRDSPALRPGSAFDRPMSSLNIRKTRKSAGGAELEPPRMRDVRSPSTPLPNVNRRQFETPPSAASTSTSGTNETGRSISRLSWAEEDSSLGLAGPKSKKIMISERDQEWVESMKDKVRQASAEKERRSRERGTSFGELEKVGGTKRLFRKGAL